MKFNILSSTWNIKEVESSSDILIVDSNRCFGVVSYREQTIYLDKTLLLQEKRKTLAHELSHAILYITQIEYKKDFSEEMLCEFVGKYCEIINSIINKYFAKKII